MTRTVDTHEPLLSAVARKLGRAAGTLANMTHTLAMNSGTTGSRTPSKKKTAKRAQTKESGKRSTRHRQTKAKKRGTTRRVAARAKAKLSQPRAIKRRATKKR